MLVCAWGGKGISIFFGGGVCLHAPDLCIPPPPETPEPFPWAPAGLCGVAPTMFTLRFSSGATEKMPTVLCLDLLSGSPAGERCCHSGFPEKSEAFGLSPEVVGRVLFPLPPPVRPPFLFLFIYLGRRGKCGYILEENRNQNKFSLGITGRMFRVAASSFKHLF